MLNKYFAVAALCSFFMISCGSGQSVKEIDIDGSSTVYPITEAVAEEFRAVAPNVRVTIGVSGTGGGFQKFVTDKLDITNASRKIKPVEAEKAQKNNIEYLKLAVALDGLAVVKNPKNDWASYITVKELKKMWEPAAQGKINKWSQIREGWPDKPIHLYGPGVASGTYDYFTEVIVGESGASRGDYTASEDDNVLVQGVSTDKYALGFFGLAYYQENAKELDLVAVDNGKGEPVKPTLETVSNNTYAPLSRRLFIYVSKDAAQKKHVQQFIKFYLKHAAKLANQVGYVPMADSVYQNQLQKFKAFAGASDSTSTSQPTAAETK